MTNRDSVLKSRDITLPTKVHLVKAMVFPLVMYECESWTIKKSLSAKELMPSNCDAEKISWVPWTARRSNQSILKEINPEYSLEGLMLKLKAQHFGHLMQRANSLETTISNRKDWRQEEKGMTGWDCWMVSLSQRTWVWANSGRWWRTGMPGVPQSMGLQRIDNWKNWKQQQLVDTCSLVAEPSPKEH